MSRTLIACIAAALIGTVPPVLAQTPAEREASLKFEVASLKASQPGGRGGGIRPAPGGERYIATNIPLRLLMMVAYRVKADQIAGGSGWMQTDLWDMNAKAERPSTVEELHVMLQNLLADRFKLKFHRETRELPVYALTVDKGGSKMQPHEAQSAGDPWIEQSVEQVVRATMTAKFVPMDYFAWRLGQLLDRPVIDQTRLKGGYDFILKFTRDLPPGIPEGANLNGAPIDTSGPNIFEALRQQLGLRLEAQKGPVEIMVVDHVEKPVEN
jgi:uncharacterized protein (TIGR03435 family)